MLTTSVCLAEKYDYLDEKLKKAYEFLKRDDLIRLEPGTYPIEGDEVFAQVQCYTTVPAQEAQFESHNQYVDVQFMVEGFELFGYIPREELKVETMPYDKDRDIAFYAEPEEAFKASYVFLRPGDLAIVPPDDAHKPRCVALTPAPVKKVVVKIKV